MLLPLLIAAALPLSIDGIQNILMIVADDLGRNDLGARNGGLTVTPAIDSLISSGVSLGLYHTFKICSPSRASSLTGRYPWGAGFYDMSPDNEHTTTNFTLYPALLQRAGFKTHAIGKYDVGFMVKNATATYRGFDDFYGYYQVSRASSRFGRTLPSDMTLRSPRTPRKGVQRRLLVSHDSRRWDIRVPE